jgi:hypothetical protein
MAHRRILTLLILGGAVLLGCLLFFIGQREGTAGSESSRSHALAPTHAEQPTAANAPLDHGLVDFGVEAYTGRRALDPVVPHPEAAETCEPANAAKDLVQIAELELRRMSAEPQATRSAADYLELFGVDATDARVQDVQQFIGLHAVNEVERELRDACNLAARDKVRMGDALRLEPGVRHTPVKSKPGVYGFKLTDKNNSTYHVIIRPGEFADVDDATDRYTQAVGRLIDDIRLYVSGSDDRPGPALTTPNSR